MSLRFTDTNNDPAKLEPNFFWLRSRDRRKIRLRAARLLGRHTEKQWHNILASVNGRCVRCCRFFGEILYKDHIRPIHCGGSDGAKNLQPLCWSCNTSKGKETTNWLKIRNSQGWPEGV